MAKKHKLPKKMFKLNVPAKDTASGLNGVLTHMQIFPNGVTHYIFQPGALNPETGSPVDRHWLTEDRIECDQKVDMPKLPVKAFGTECEDMATGFRGKVISFVIHPDGCVHVELQPQGSEIKTGKKKSAHEFDIRRLNGEVIKPMEDEEYRKSIKLVPSPAGMDSFEPSAMGSASSVLP